MLRQSLPCAVLLLVIGIGLQELHPRALAGDDTEIRWKAFDKSSTPFFQVLTTSTTQIMVAEGTEIKQEQKQTFVIKWTPEEKDSDGNWVVKQQIIGIKLEFEIGANKISFDSEDQEAPKNPFSKFFESLMESFELKLHIKPFDLSIQRIEGHKELLAKLSGKHPQQESLLKNLLNEQALRQMAAPGFDAFPTEAVRKSWTDQRKTWKCERTLDLGQIGLYKTNSTYTWDGKDKVKIESSLTYTGPRKKNQDGGLAFTIKEGNLTGKDAGNSYAVFDLKKGRLKEMTTAISLKGALKIEINDKVMSVTVDQTQSTTAESFDNNPLATKIKK